MGSKEEYASNLEVGQYVRLRCVESGSVIGRVGQLTDKGIYIWCLDGEGVMAGRFIEYKVLRDLPRSIPNYYEEVTRRKEIFENSLVIGANVVINNSYRGVLLKVLPDALVLYCDTELCIPIVTIYDIKSNSRSMIKWCREHCPPATQNVHTGDLVNLMRDAYIKHVMER